MKGAPIFPKDFIFGTATSAYQVEGAWDADGKGESIWDRFTRKRGKVRDGTNGRMACDQYHRYAEDVEIMRRLGIGSYRFSVSWPRVLPSGTGKINHAGLDYYDRLVDTLKAASIEPFVTLYHWDLPAALQDLGGWTNPDIRSRFAEYASLMVRRLGDRVRFWTTMNEPWMFVFVGHLLGWHPPGSHNPWAAMRALHNALCAHGSALGAIRAENPDIRIGITLSLSPLESATKRPRDVKAAERADLFMNRLLLDPLFGRGYPEAIRKLLRFCFPHTSPEEMDLISTPIDFLGINNYTREIIRYAWWLPVLRYWSNLADVPERDYEKDGIVYTDMGYEFFPESIYRVLARMRDEYGNPPVFVTENGASFTDCVENGSVHDPKRTAFISSYISEVSRAYRDGCDVRGYFVWSLLDNFEWAYGYGKRHGIAHVDFADGRRIIKDSGYEYARIISGARKG